MVRERLHQRGEDLWGAVSSEYALSTEAGERECAALRINRAVWLSKVLPRPLETVDRDHLVAITHSRLISVTAIGPATGGIFSSLAAKNRQARFPASVSGAQRCLSEARDVTV
jgi:hypothetical protein